MEKAISTAARFLETAFDVLNAHYFEVALSKPVITIQSSPRFYGHCSVDDIWKGDDGDARKEINLGAETLNRPVENTIATLLHEMVHLHNLQKGIKDCSRGNTYHNKRFKDEAEKRGLIIEYDKRIGWSVTTPSPALIELVKTQGWEKLDFARAGLGVGQSIKKPSSTRKYVCPCCDTSVRATKEVNILCADCNVMMELAQ